MGVEHISSDMREEHIRTLARITSDFYQQESSSFSQTRERGWVGWAQVEQHLIHQMRHLASPCVIYDVGCGNLRFERTYADVLEHSEVHAFDNCADLMRSYLPRELSYQLTLHHLDLIDTLLYFERTQKIPEVFTYLPAPHVLLCFGVMHHIPTQELRCAYMRLIGRLMQSGVMVALSFWRFLEDEKLAAKVGVSHANSLRRLNNASIQALLFEPTDRLLGWSDVQGVARFCHSFTQAEIDELQNCLLDELSHPFEIVRYRADGKQGNLNEYLIAFLHG